MEPGIERFSPEGLLMRDTADDNEAPTSSLASNNKNNNNNNNKSDLAKEDELISMETLRESPVQWPERFPGMDDFLNMSDTPIHTPNADSSPNLNKDQIERMNELSLLTPELLIEKIKSMHDQVYQLGLRESKEMTRGKLLGIFDHLAKAKK